MNRYFIALPVPLEIREKIKAFITDHANLSLNWETEQNWHITLIPTKEIDDANLEIWKDKCSKYLAEGVFTIDFKNVAAGPSPEDIRLLWVTAESTPPLIELKNGLEQLLGFMPEHPKFIPHITLGRVHHQEQIDSALKHFKEPVHWTMKVDRFAIFKSEKLNGDHLYTIIQEYPI